MRLTVVGCSPASGNPGEAQSGYLVDHDGGSLLLDCGNGVVERLRAGGHTPADIILSHLHPDHFFDVFTIAFALHDSSDSWRPTLWLPPGGRIVVDEMLRALGWGLRLIEETLPIREYRSARGLELGGATLSFAATRHSAHSYLIRVVAGGRTLVYSGDTAPGPQIAVHAAGCDLLLCDATVADGDDPAPTRTHLTAEEAAGAARSAGARSLVLTHLAAAMREPALAAARAAFDAAQVATPGASFEV